jgi:hypothetical protein
MTMNRLSSVVVAAAAMTFAQAACAQVYRPDAFGKTNHTQQLEADALRMDAFRASRDPMIRPRADDKPEPLTFFTRLGNYAAENPGDGFTLRRATGPKMGNVGVGLRRKF